MDNKTKMYLPQKCKTDGNMFVEDVGEMSGCASLLPSFQNKWANVVADDVELQGGEAEVIGLAVPLLMNSCSSHDVMSSFAEVTCLSEDSGENEVVTLNMLEFFFIYYMYHYIWSIQVELY